MPRHRKRKGEIVHLNEIVLTGWWNESRRTGARFVDWLSKRIQEEDNYMSTVINGLLHIGGSWTWRSDGSFPLSGGRVYTSANLAYNQVSLNGKLYILRGWPELEQYYAQTQSKK